MTAAGEETIVRMLCHVLANQATMLGIEAYDVTEGSRDKVREQASIARDVARNVSDLLDEEPGLDD